MSPIKPSDLDLMMLADGELDGERAREVAAAVERDPDLRAKLDAVAQVGEGVRTYLETEVDRLEGEAPAFAADMWSAIERGIAAGGRAPVQSDGVERRPAAAASDVEAGGAMRAWLAGHRGHLMTGLVSAAATAALVFALRQPAGGGGEPLVAERAPMPPVTAATVAAAPCGPPTVGAPAAPPEVESFEVYDGSGLVFTLPGEDASDSGATVIWISKDHDTLEGPI